MQRIPRKFYLSSASGERYGLNGERGVWLTDPSGLGIVLSPGFANARNGFFAVVLTDEVPQGAVYGTLVFTGGSPYDDYQAFVNWALAAGDGLSLVYAPTPTAEFYRGVTLSSLSKSEIRRPGWLSCELTLLGGTPWYKPTQLRIDLTPDSATGMRYPWRYAPETVYPVDVNGSMRALLNAGGHIPSALVMTYTGAALNPTLRLVGAITGTDYGRLALTAKLAAGDRLEYSSRYLNTYIRRVAADGSVEDLIDYVDLAYEPWLRLPLTEPATFYMTAEGPSLPGDAKVKIFDYYWSV